MKTSLTFAFTNYYGKTYTENVPFRALRSMVRAVRSPLFCLARARSTLCGYPVTLIYHRDASSPSGKMLADSGPAFIVDRLLSKHGRTSPLSPTEMLTGPSNNIL